MGLLVFDELAAYGFWVPMPLLVNNPQTTTFP